jgi:hypothetical protein
MKLTLTDNDGVIINQWSIGNKPEFNIEDLNADPQYDFYLDGNYNDFKDIGEAVWKEAWFYINHTEE